MYAAGLQPQLTAEELMFAYDAAGAEAEWAEMLMKEAVLRARYYADQGMDQADAFARSGYDLAEHRAARARREFDAWWEQIRPKVLISDGGSL